MLEHYTCGLLALRTLEHVHLVQLVSGGEVVLRHVVDAQMAADMLAKWLPGPKLELCLRYICNSW